uniref:Uncharacterized protein n=1 Tax=Melanthalia intermedia TaxID=172989 RepID=A0A345UB20_9FLOR|nr:hypothetical protein [Melanthalia intermedia]AXI97656.1 hypothetical protein [Melanthalia intermedia]
MITLQQNDVENILCPLSQDRCIKFFMILDRLANQEISFDHFYAFLLLEKTKNIVAPSSLDVNGMRGIYMSRKDWIQIPAIRSPSCSICVVKAGKKMCL